MVLQPKRMDVTGRVTGKLKDGELELFFDNQPIGKTSLPLSDIQLEPNFEVVENKIIHSFTSTEGPESRYTDCDEGGWC